MQSKGHSQRGKQARLEQRIRQAQLVASAIGISGARPQTGSAARAGHRAACEHLARVAVAAFAISFVRAEGLTALRSLRRAIAGRGRVGGELIGPGVAYDVVQRRIRGRRTSFQRGAFGLRRAGARDFAAAGDEPDRDEPCVKGACSPRTQQPSCHRMGDPASAAACASLITGRETIIVTDAAPRRNDDVLAAKWLTGLRQPPASHPPPRDPRARV